MDTTHPQSPVLLFAFANDDGRSLRQLDEEQRALRKIFEQSDLARNYKICILPAATAQDVVDAFQKYRGQIRIFHYGGHSNENELFFKSTFSDHRGANAGSLADFLALREGLELIFLNSCLSLAQAQQYLRSGTKNVIATSRAIGDFAAREFATQFYKALATGADIKLAYWEAEKSFQWLYGAEYRGFELDVEESEDPCPWELRSDGTRSWSLASVAGKNTPALVRSPIRGLLSFESKDAVLFQSLQRNEDVARLQQAIIRQDFSVGILTGDSGCGKTSFLQAGLQPALEAAGYQVVYVKCANTSPLQSMQRALPKTLQQTIPENHTFLQLLDQLNVKDAQQPWVFLFDQFEQFFTHFRSKESRAAFIADLKNWYRSRSEYPIKLLFSVRQDMLYLSYELQEELGFNLTYVQTYFQLEKFTPAQATQIFKVMAELQDIEFDEAFVQDMCAKELASLDKKLAAQDKKRISAVDIQILAMILQGQQTTTDRAFNRRAFERMGGIEGLLQRYLQEQLKAPNVYNRNQAALNVLLALVNLDHNVRAGLLTLDQLQDKLNGILAPELLPSILEWLCTVRLANKIVEEDRVPAYELAHERLIIPLRNVKKPRIDQLSHDLDRRVNEWLGNGRTPRYLFNLAELWALQQYRRSISWEPKRPQKEALINASWGWWKKRLWLMCGFCGLCLVLGIFLNTPSGMMLSVKYWEFPRSLKYAYPGTCAEAAPMLVNVHPELAKQVLEYIHEPELVLSTLLVMCDSLMSDSSRHVKEVLEFHGLAYSYVDSLEDEHSRNEVLMTLAITAGELAKYTKDVSYLAQGAALAQQIEDDDYRASVLSALAVVAGELAKHTQDVSYLAQGEALAKKIEYAYYRASALSKLAVVAGELGQKTKALDYLTQGEALAKEIEDAFFRAEALSVLAVTAGELGQKTKDASYLTQGVALAKEIEDAYFRAKALIALAVAAGELGQKTNALNYLTQGEVLAQKIGDARSRALKLITLVVTAGEIAKSTQDVSYLAQGEALAKKIEPSGFRGEALSVLAVAAGELGQKTKALDYLIQGEALAHARFREEVLRRLAIAAIELTKHTKDASYLTQGEALAKKIKHALFRAEMLSKLAVAAGELAKHTKDASYMIRGEALAQIIEDDAFSRTEALIALAVTAGELGQKTKALDYLTQGEALIKKIESAYSRTEALSKLAVTAVELAGHTKDASYLTQGAALANKIESADSRADALSKLAKVASTLERWKKAHYFVQAMPIEYRLSGYARLLHQWAKPKAAR